MSCDPEPPSQEKSVLLSIVGPSLRASQSPVIIMSFLVSSSTFSVSRGAQDPLVGSEDSARSMSLVLEIVESIVPLIWRVGGWRLEDEDGVVYSS